MIAFAFSFPAGRYHATPWGRHANEADVAWPPEPVRILRALIATWWRKGDHDRFPKAMLDDLIDALAVEAPVFRLPDAVHTHVRAFMPAPQKRRLIYDAFLRLDRGAELIVAWLDVTLSSEQYALAMHLLEQIGYLGRAESWAEGRIAGDWDGEFNACPRNAAASVAEDSAPIDVAAPVTPVAWTEFRSQPLSGVSGRKIKQRERALLEATLPPRLADALAVDTSEWQKAGWSSPPPLRWIVYDRPAVGPLPTHGRPRRPTRTGQPGSPEVARFVLAGRPRPRIEDTLRIAEITRWALMSIGDSEVPVELCGRDEGGALRDDPTHRHAFYLPEDADSDDLIDHLVIYCRLGFSSEARRRLDRLTRLWIEHGRADEEGERGRKEWRVALEDIAAPAAFADSRLLTQARAWESVTPYLKPRFDRRRPKSFEAVIGSYRRQVIAEWERRFPGAAAPQVEPMLDPRNPARFAVPVGPGRALRSTLGFARARGGRGGPQVDTSGGLFRMVFGTDVEGPIALGWGAHFGLGLFRRVAHENA